MGEMERRLLTFELLNCHLEDAGRKTVACDVDQRATTACTKMMTDAEFQLYTSFFIDIDHVCFFLNHEIWMDRIQLTVDLLESTSAHVSKELGTMETKTKEISRAVEHLESLQLALLSSVEHASSSAFYIAAVVVVFLLTIPQRSSGARLPCLIVLGLGALLERNHDALRGLLKASLPLIGGGTLVNSDALLWLLRNVCASLCVLLLVVQAYRWRDITADSLRTIERFLDAQLDERPQYSSAYSKKQK